MLQAARCAHARGAQAGGGVAGAAAKCELLAASRLHGEDGRGQCRHYAPPHSVLRRECSGGGGGVIKIQFHYVRAHCVAHVSGAGVRARLRLRGGLVLRPLALDGRLPGGEVAALLHSLSCTRGAAWACRDRSNVGGEVPADGPPPPMAHHLSAAPLRRPPPLPSAVERRPSAPQPRARPPRRSSSSTPSAASSSGPPASRDRHQAARRQAARPLARAPLHLISSQSGLRGRRWGDPPSLPPQWRRLRPCSRRTLG